MYQLQLGPACKSILAQTADVCSTTTLQSGAFLQADGTVTHNSLAKVEYCCVSYWLEDWYLQAALPSLKSCWFMMQLTACCMTVATQMESALLEPSTTHAQPQASIWSLS